jgi:hypothetical protein
MQEETSMNRISLTMLLGALVALVAAVPAAAATAPAIQTVTKQVPVKQGKVTESKVFCPPSTAAIAGTVVKHPTGSTIRRSLPSAVRSWRFAFGGFVGSKGKATVTVRCAALNVPAAAGRLKLNVNTVSRGFGVDALSSTTRTINCRSGYVPTGWGFDIPAPTATQDVVPAAETQIYEAISTRVGFAFGAENLGGGGAVVRLRVRCIQERVAGKAGLSHRWRIKRERFKDRARSGVRTLKHSCPAGYVSIGLGHAAAVKSDLNFRRSFDVRSRGARWVFDNGGKADTVATQLLCLNTGTSFR